MPNILIAEGTPAVWQAERTRFGIPSNFSLFAAAVQLHRPGIRCTLLNIADGEALAFGTTLSDFDGVMIPGSPLQISRIIARLSTMPAQAPSACTTRPAISAGNDHAAPHSAVPRRNAARPASNTGRRPKRSETGP